MADVEPNVTPDNFLSLSEVADKNNYLQSMRFDLVYQLVLKGAYNTETRFENPQRILQIISDIETHRPLRSEEEIKIPLNEVQQQMESVIAGLVKHKVLPQNIVSDIAAHFSLEDIKIEGPNAHMYSIFYDEQNQFATRDTLFFPAIGSFKQLDTAMKEEGITLDQQTYQTIRSKETLGHEYGHAVVASFIRKRIASLIESEQEKKGMDLADYEIKDLVKKAEQQIYQEIYEMSPLSNPKMYEIFSDLGEQTIFPPAQTSIERIPMAIEFATLRIALLEAGIENERVVRIVNKVKSFFVKGQEDFPRLYNACRSRNLDINQAVGGLPLLRFVVQGNSKLQHYIETLVTSTHGGREIGYYYPLTEEQLSNWLKTYPSPDYRAMSK